MTEGFRTCGKWSQPGLPHKGWVCVHVEDLGYPSSTCEMCETQEIRYVHYMQHPNYPGQLGCGCVCAGRMEEDSTQAEKREKTLQNAGARRKRWLTRARRVSAKGNPFFNSDGYNIAITNFGNGWKFRVVNREPTRRSSPAGRTRQQTRRISARSMRCCGSRGTATDGCRHQLRMLRRSRCFGHARALHPTEALPS